MMEIDGEIVCLRRAATCQSGGFPRVNGERRARVTPSLSLLALALIAPLLASCATPEQRAEARIRMQQEMVMVRQRRAAILSGLASPEAAATIGHTIGCAIAGGCLPPPQARTIAPKECRAELTPDPNGNLVYRCM